MIVFKDDDYYIIDCPGQIELYTHLDVMKVIVDKLKSWDFRIGAVFLMDSQFLVERGKYISGTMAALSCMTKLEVPHMNIMTKIDVLRIGLKWFKKAVTKSGYSIIKKSNYDRHF